MKLFEKKNWDGDEIILCRDISFYGNPVENLCTLEKPLFLKRIPTKEEAQFLFSILNDQHLNDYSGLNFIELEQIKFKDEK